MIPVYIYSLAVTPDGELIAAEAALQFSAN
jgi:hypothetical protein